MRPGHHAAWLRGGLLLLCAAACFACEGPGRRIALASRPKRPPPLASLEDAGPEVPDGAVLCAHDSECDDGIACTNDVCLPPGYCINTPDHSRCSDNLVCDGFEACDPTQGCVTAPPLSCDDQDPCTIDRCDESQKGCVHDPRDFDHDGEADIHCGGTDCDDFDPTRSTSAKEICGDGVDNDCDNQVDEADCGKLPHDACDDPLDISAGGTFELPVVGAVSDYSESCNDLPVSHDLVATFTLREPHDVKLVAHGLLGSGADEEAVLALERACGDSGKELKCTHGFPGDLRVRALPAGTYYVVIATSYVAQTVLLEASFDKATSAPTNTTCDKALDVGTGGHFVGDFVDVGDDIMSACAIAGQPDVFYKVTLDAEHDIEVSALADEPTPLPIVLSVRSGCNADANTLSCDDGPRVLTDLHQQPKGTYIIVLEGPTTSEIGYALDVAIKPPTPPLLGDSCKQPLPLQLGMSQRVQLLGLQDDIATSCQGAGPDAVLSLHLNSAQDLQISADSNNAVAALALQAHCGDTTSELVCRSGASLNTRIHDVPAGDYDLVVDSATASALTLQVNGLPPTQPVSVSGNDTCDTAQDIPDAGGVFSGDTSKLQKDYTGNCGGGAASKDAAFRLVLTAPKHVVASVDAAFDAVLLRFNGPSAGGAACAPGDLAQCNDDGPSGSDPQLDETLAPGTYYYIVDGYKDFNSGPYSFDVLVSDP